VLRQYFDQAMAEEWGAKVPSGRRAVARYCVYLPRWPTHNRLSTDDAAGQYTYQYD
jgi:hypothetical protein